MQIRLYYQTNSTYFSLLVVQSESTDTAASSTRVADAQDRSSSMRLCDHFSQISSRHALL